MYTRWISTARAYTSTRQSYTPGVLVNHSLQHMQDQCTWLSGAERGRLARIWLLWHSCNGYTHTHTHTPGLFLWHVKRCASRIVSGCVRMCVLCGPEVSQLWPHIHTHTHTHVRTQHHKCSLHVCSESEVHACVPWAVPWESAV